MLVNSPSTPVTASYGYESNTGELLTVSYNDAGETLPTPGVSYTYSRLGQVATVADAVGTRTFNYDSTYPWRLANEAMPSFFYSRVLTRLYEASTSASAGAFHGYTKGTVKGRAVGFDLGTAGNPTQDLQQSYTVANTGFFVGVTSQVGTSAAQDFTYSYYSNSELLSGYWAGSSFTVSRTYETQRDLVTSVQTNWGSTSLSRFDFSYDALYRRQTAKQSGTAFSDYYSGLGYSGVYNVYAYNARSELQTAAMYRGDTPTTSPSSSDELPGRRFEYRYDSIGNRVTAGETGSANSGDDEYTANALNQYTQKENNTVRALGTTASGATVAVAGASSTGKKDRTWGADVVPANTSSAVQGNVTVYAAFVGGGQNGKDLINTSTAPFFIPLAAQSFTYDADGNVASDGVWNYIYDAENRLVRLQSALSAGLGFTRRQLDFTYDYLGRRVAKTVTNMDTSTQILARRFLYDGWNLIAELDGTGANLQRSYTWGLDLTGDLTHSGGVGALLQVYDYPSSKTFWATYDSNGNVASLVNAASGNFGAVYEYDPYGNYLRAEVGDQAVQDNPFRFSTKYADAESGLVYYGLRYYSPSLGRFINRDPIEEQGGLSLYAFCANNGVNRWDYLGMLYGWGQDDPSWDDERRRKNQEYRDKYDNCHDAGSYPEMFGGFSGLGDTSWMGGYFDDQGKFTWTNPQAPPPNNGLIDRYFGFGSNETGKETQETAEEARQKLEEAGYVIQTGTTDGKPVSFTITDSDGNIVLDIALRQDAGFWGNVAPNSTDVSAPTVYSLANPAKASDGSNVYYRNDKFVISDAIDFNNHVETDGMGGLKVVITEPTLWVLTNPVTLLSIYLHESIHINDMLASDPNIGANLPEGLLVTAASQRARRLTELNATHAQIAFLDAVRSSPNASACFTPTQLAQITWYQGYVQNYQNRFTGEPQQPLPPIPSNW